MILADVNVLVYAFQDAADDHEQYRAWLLDTLNGPGDFALTDATLVGFVRIVTNPRIFEHPANNEAARQFVASLVTAPRSRWIAPSNSAWRVFDDLLDTDRQLRGNLVPDAWLASLAISHRCRLATADRGFGRFPGLDWFDPAA